MDTTERNMRRAVALTGALLVGTLLIAGTAFAQQPMTTNNGAHINPGGPVRWVNGSSTQPMRHPGVFGQVTAISGDTITLTSKGFGPRASSSTPTTYTINASGATVMKDNATSSVSAIVVGDTLMVEGTVNGDTVTATVIHDGPVPRGLGGPRDADSNFTGNGEPVVGGTIKAINGSTLTLTNKSNVTYTIDVSNAAVTKHGATSTVSALTTGDNVLVQGTVNGTNITASAVLDQGAVLAAATTNGQGDNNQNTVSGAPGRSGEHGFFGVVGGFFHRLFGFF